METVNLTVTAQQFNTIMAGLEELPHKVSRLVIDTLVQQVKAQTEPKAEPVPEPVVETVPAGPANVTITD